MPHFPGIQAILSAMLAGRVEAVAGTAEWNVVADAAERLGLAGLLLEALPDAGVSPPESAERALRAAATAVASANVHRTRCFRPVARAFDETGIPLMLLKGAALQLLIYRRPYLRPMSDVDCMVQPEDLDRAVAVLSSLGCRRGGGGEYGPTLVHDAAPFGRNQAAR